MNIRPKNTILFAQTGVKFSQNNLRGANWRQQVFNNYRQHLLDQLAKYGEADDYGKWLNEMQARHSNIYNLAGGEKGNWEDIAYKNDLVGQYQQDYRGGLDNDGQYKRYGSIQLNDSDRYDFNQTGIKTNQGTRYNIANPPTRTSGDYSRSGYNYKVDNLYSAITDDRRLLGRKGDWDENSDEYKSWQKDLNSKGWETYLDTSDNYYKLRRLNTPPSSTPQNQQKKNEIPVGQKDDSTNSFWDKLSTGFKNIAPDLLDALRLAGNMYNNERVYNESMKAIIPNLQQTYLTHRQVVGDEATKQAYYRRAAQGQTKAGQPFTSDADRQVAYMQEARRVGDELRAQGDLADNQEIRRTSDESNQHQWANTQRLTENANYNTTEINKANAARHQLTAQKYSADWTNQDQYLLGWQAKFQQKQNKQKELEQQLALLDTKENLLGDTKLKDLKTATDEAYDAYYNEKDINKKASLKQKYEELFKEYQLYNIKLTRENLINQYNGVYRAKSGTKITKKDTTDKYLYKTSRDIVEHFRRMSKITDDSRVRTMPKPIKTSSHPRKMQLGGVAPFTIYRPLGVGGETTTQTSTSTEGSKSSKDTAAKDKLDMIKELFKQVQGLPVDVSKVYQEIAMTLNKAKAFGEELTTDDIASMYLNSMNKMAQLKYSAEAYKQAHTQAVANEALNEIAVGSQGELILQDRETGEIKRGTLTQLKESEGKLNALTNSQLLEVRAKSPNLAFNDDIFNIVNNGVGLSKISKEIKAMAASLGSQERKLEGVTEVQNRKIKAGLQTLAGYDGTPDGFYKVTQDSKESKANVSAALNYIYNMLPTNYKVIMKLHSGSEEASKNLIAQYLMSQTSDFYKEDVAPLTGKASDKDGKDSSEKIKSNPLMQLIQGEGGVPRTWNLITKDSNIKMSVDGIEYSQLPKITEDMSLDKMLSESGIAGILDSKQGITFGDQNISPDQLKDVMYSNSGGMVVTLPCKIVNGHKEVNLGVKKTYEEAIQEVESKGISKNSSEYYKILGEVLKQKGLNSLLDSNGYPDKNKFGQFLVVEAYTTDKIKNLDTSSQYIEKVKNPDAQLEERMTKALSTDSKKSNYSLDIDYWLYGDDVYRGTVFIPLSNNLNAAINASGSQISVENARELENKFQNFNKASNMKSSNSDVL